MFHFFFQALIEWGFLALLENEKREKSDRKRRRIFFYFEIKTVAAVVHARNFKSSVYACFSVVGMVKLHMHQVFLIIFLLYANVLLFFGSFFGLFLFQSLGFRGFQRD